MPFSDLKASLESKSNLNEPMVILEDANLKNEINNKEVKKKKNATTFKETTASICVVVAIGLIAHHWGYQTFGNVFDVVESNTP